MAGGYRPPPRSRQGCGPGNRRRVARNHGANPPPLFPPLPPLRPAGYWRRAKGAPTLYQPQGQGKSPPPQKSHGARGRNAAEPVRRTPPRRHPPAPTVTTIGRQTGASTQGRPADHTRGQQANTNRSNMEATPSMI